MSPRLNGLHAKRIRVISRKAKMFGEKGPNHIRLLRDASAFRDEMRRINSKLPQGSKVTRQEMQILLSPKVCSLEVVHKIATKIPLKDLAMIKGEFYSSSESSLGLLPNFENLMQSQYILQLRQEANRKK